VFATRWTRPSSATPRPFERAGLRATGRLPGAELVEDLPRAGDAARARSVRDRRGTSVAPDTMRSTESNAASDSSAERCTREGRVRRALRRRGSACLRRRSRARARSRRDVAALVRDEVARAARPHQRLDVACEENWRGVPWKRTGAPLVSAAAMALPAAIAMRVGGERSLVLSPPLDRPLHPLPVHVRRRCSRRRGHIGSCANDLDASGGDRGRGSRTRVRPHVGEASRRPSEARARRTRVGFSQRSRGPAPVQGNTGASRYGVDDARRTSQDPCSPTAARAVIAPCSWRIDGIA